MRESAKDRIRASEKRRRASSGLALAVAVLAAGASAAYAQTPPPAPAFIPGPTDPPDVFGVFPNYANSPLPVMNDPASCPGPSFCGIRKFVDTLPGLGAAGANNLGQYLPVAVPDTATYPGSDYYEIELGEYAEQMHSDLPATKLRGYRQTNMGGTPYHYLGPIIVAQRDRPVRIRFTNGLPTGAGGNLFIPVDTTYMGAGEGPLDAAGNACEPGAGGACVPYAQNRATIHLHGATTPWISDGTVHQWITPAGESTPYPKGVSVRNVPDMWFDASGNTVAAGTPGATNDPGPGRMTFFYTNQQSARLMFYHDHASGITRLNVYAGMAAGYLLTDPVEQNLVAQGVLPQDEIPLVIQDKTFVPDDTRPFVNQVGSFPSQLKAQDPTWDSARWGGFGQLWFPHVYMPNQNPYDLAGANAMGRWDYGPWFWPPFTGLTYGPIPNPYAANAGEPPFAPGTPDGRLLSPSGVPEAFMDTPVVNGTAYPTLTVDPKAYRFRILNAADDRYWNLSLFLADSTVTAASGVLNTEVKMVPFNSSQNAAAPFPTWWYDGSVANPFDDRVGGVPDPATRGPAMIQIGTEGGFLPAPVVIKNQPINYVMNKRDITIGNVKEHALFLGPAERADVVIDFTNFAGKTLIVYNDGAAPVPAADPRLDYFTGGPDMTDTGGAPPTLPGFGPNTRTIMQIVVRSSGGTSTAPVDDVNPTLLAGLNASLPAAFAASQEPIIVPQSAYNGVYASTPVTDVVGSAFATIQATSMTFTPYRQASPLLVDMEPKSIIEDFQMDYGRMNAMLGVELKHTNVTNQTSIPQYYVDPPTELVKLTTDPFTVPLGAPSDGTQLWKITHNGVDTHAVHFHMFHVQIVNRVGWDGAIRPPEPNELGWKDTVRMNPLEDVIVALRPRTLALPFKVGNSSRLMNPARPPGSPMGFTNVDPQGNPVTVTNDLVNFGWEYVWHCHLLGHEENDMMRALVVANPPEQATNLAGAFSSPSQVRLSWTDSSLTANGFRIERATDALFTQNLVTTTPATYATTFTDTVPPDASYYYRVTALNTVGSSVLGYPTLTAEATPSATATVAPVPAATLSPAALTFGTRVVGTVSPAQAVTLSSVGTGSLSGISVALSGANAGDFGTSTTCGATLAPGTTCTVSVTFAPTAAGSSFATLTVTTSDPAHPQFTVSLSGTGAVSALSASPTSLAFTSTLNVRTAAQTVTLRNDGATTVSGIGISIGGVNASQFAQSNGCGRTLAAGASCTIAVTFRPTSVGAKAAQLTVSFAAVGSPLSVPLTGAVLVPNLGVSPASLAFGTVPRNTTSPPQQVTVTNSGTGALTINGIRLGGNNPNQFAIAASSCGGTLAPNATCTVSVAFAPTSRGAKSARLSVNVAAPATSQSVSLSGTGQ